ncbi:hypothetical protein K469DRAFT_745252 [Zopfia rhizophila CBS 207.26]|uniref:Uncharacterized protein n=1 Tax=Zopfia rhizophila CBS 207.26 TaxID=1314779 RepID=A0A6A6ERZ8_9PEZI|nr:hypothetical protein K469DRAFT_745252 [Zopfia rhizophila CBS 207.26]
MSSTAGGVVFSHHAHDPFFPLSHPTHDSFFTPSHTTYNRFFPSSHPAHYTLLPQPLLIRKKPPKSTFRGQVALHASTTRAKGVEQSSHQSGVSVYPFSASSHKVHTSIEETLAAIEGFQYSIRKISRIPSSQPLTVRKTRGNGSSRSASTASNLRTTSRTSSQGPSGSSENFHVSRTSYPSLKGSFIDHELYSAPFLSVSTCKPRKAHIIRPSTSSNISLSHSILEKINDASEHQAPLAMPRGFGKRFLARILPKKEKATEASSDAVSGGGLENGADQEQSPALTTTERSDIQDTTTTLFNGSTSSAQQPNRFQERLRRAPQQRTIPRVLNLEVRIFPDRTIFPGEDIGSFWAAVELEAVMDEECSPQHGRKGLNVIIIIDNSSYVSPDCLHRSKKLAKSATGTYLRGSDRFALFTCHGSENDSSMSTHCALHPLGVYSKDVFDTELDAIKIQQLDPLKPNPTIAETVLSVLRSLQPTDCNNMADASRTHVFVLSPMFGNFSEVYAQYPAIHVHHINPARCPFRNHAEECRVEKERRESDVYPDCFVVSNWNVYQSVYNRLRRIFNYARLEKPTGSIHDVEISIQPKEGFKIQGVAGNLKVSSLRLGEVHTVFCEVKINPTQRLELCSAQAKYRSSLHPSSWVTTKMPLPIGTECTSDFYRRWVFLLAFGMDPGQALDRISMEGLSGVFDGIEDELRHQINVDK